MPLNPLYIVASDLESYFVDKDTGLPLANGTITFYRDNARNIPKQVYQLSGFPPNYTYTSMGAQITLSAVGTVQNSGGDNVVIYYYPYDTDGNLDLYYVVVRDELGVEQFTREAWPNITQELNPIIDEFPIQNQIANPQFTEITINNGFPTILSVVAVANQVFPVGPDWVVKLSGTGSVTLERIAIAGNDKVITSPPYVLDVTVTGGITACTLRQKFKVNSGLWSSTPAQDLFLSGTLIAKNQAAGTTGLQMYYLDSAGGSPVQIVDGTFDNADYSILQGVTPSAMPLSNNTERGLDGYVEIFINFLAGSHVRLSSIQVVPTTNPFSGDFLEYDVNSSNREQALMGSYYIPALRNRPGPNILTAWDFTLNPFQATDTAALLTSPAYICDQTIAQRGIAGNITVQRDTATNGLEFITTAANDSFYIMQYLSGAQAKKIIGTELSCNIHAYRSIATDDVIVRTYLFRAPSSVAIPLLPLSIGTLAANGIFTLTAVGWTEIPRGNLDTAKATLPTVNLISHENDIKFSGWELTDDTQILDTDKFAIVVTFQYIDIGTTIVIDSVALNPGPVPCRPAPQAPDEVLRECQYYYEKSYDIATSPGTATNNGSQMFFQQHSLNPVLVLIYPRFWQVIYNTKKRVPVIATIYSTGGAIGRVRAIFYNATTMLINTDALLTEWTLLGNGEAGFHYQANNRATPIVPPGIGPVVPSECEAVINYQYVADARLGVVA